MHAMPPAGIAKLVMPALVAGIHAFEAARVEDVDGRDEARP
jgi:hypothetical protein